MNKQFDVLYNFIALIIFNILKKIYFVIEIKLETRDIKAILWQYVLVYCVF